MWQTKGIARNIDIPIIAPYSQRRSIVNWLYPRVIRSIKDEREKYKFAGISSLEEVNTNYPIIYKISPDALSEIREGDILRLCPDGTIQKVFEFISDQNVLFITER